ncbi:MAG: hypothetical protein R3F41_08770 [Gammaproteobacteria bacterium]|nr:hypothetical protein [Pseudomonadales bacterium]
MKAKAALFTLFAVLTLPFLAVAEEVTINYTYEGTIRPDFSNMSRGPLKVGEFTDSRGGNPNQIVDGYEADRPLADIVRDALIQGLEKGKAGLVDSGENMSLVGAIESTEMQMVDGSIQLTIRTRVQLQGSGRTIWQTVLFGRGTVPESDGMAKAVAGAMDRTIRGLVQDDYFLIEVL